MRRKLYNRRLFLLVAIPLLVTGFFINNKLRYDPKKIKRFTFGDNTFYTYDGYLLLNNEHRKLNN